MQPFVEERCERAGLQACVRMHLSDSGLQPLRSQPVLDTIPCLTRTAITRSRERSQQWYQRAQQRLVEGVNSPSRGAAVFSPGPVVLERGRGTQLWDIDGNQYTDFMMSFGALIHGHAHPAIIKAVQQSAAEGSHFASSTPAELEAAERFCRMVPSAEVVRFANTGSEATMLALRLARAHTGRNRFLKFEGHYHGWYDPYLLNAHSALRTRRRASPIPPAYRPISSTTL
jgi:glutamate-1-semialdehyde aminotransferase